MYANEGRYFLKAKQVIPPPSSLFFAGFLAVFSGYGVEWWDDMYLLDIGSMVGPSYAIKVNPRGNEREMFISILIIIKRNACVPGLLPAHGSHHWRHSC